MSIDAVFAQFFDNIHDPRQHAKIYYPFYDVLFLTVCAVIGGAEGWEDIEDFGEVHLPWFQSKGLFKNGIPVHDTIARIISGIKPEPFQAAFVRWTQAINQHTDGALVAIDGKTLRSSYDREDRTSTIHMVSAYAAANKLVLGQIKTDAKSNEITAIPELLALLDIKGCLVSIDAMGCQTEIAETILPRTRTPGAKDAGAGLFMATFVSDCYTARQQATFRAGLADIDKRAGGRFVSLAPEARTELLRTLDAEAKSHTAEVTETGTPEEGEAMPHYFTMLKQLAIFGFFTSKVGATGVLQYVAVPGRYDGDLAYVPGTPAWGTS